MTSTHLIQELFRSIKENNGQALEDLLKAGCNPNARHRNMPAIISAVVENKLLCVEILIRYNVNVNERDHDGRTAAMFACIYDRQDILARLVRKDANLKMASSSDGMTACMYACQHNSMDCLRLIIDTGRIDLNDKGKKGNTALMLAVKYKKTICSRHLVAKGADINITNCHGWSPLTEAIYVGDSDSACYLIEQGANVNVEDHLGRTPLSTALELKYFDFKLIEQLLLKGAKPNIQMNDSYYLHEMIAKGQPEIVRLMVINGFRPVVKQCTIESLNFEGIFKPISPLAVALLSNSVHTAKYLIANSFLTRFDVCQLPYDRDIINYLSDRSYDQGLDLIKSMYSNPFHLLTLSFVTISDSLLASHEKQSSYALEYINQLPSCLQHKLRYKTDMALLCPNSWGDLPLNFDSLNYTSGLSKLLILWPLRLPLVKCECELCFKSQGYKPFD